MKYWRGYLVAAIFAAITWALTEMADRFTALMDMIYPYITRMIQNMLVQWSGGVDFVVWQVLLVAMIAVVIATIVLMVIFKWNPIQWFGWIVATASFIFLLHTVLFGLNNYASDLSDDLHMETGGYTTATLEDATEYYLDKANTLAMQMDRDANDDLVFPSFEEMALQAADGFDYLVYERFYPVFAGDTAPVKQLGWSNFWTSAGITGITMAITGEAAVNPQIPVVLQPFTMCHEMGHRMSIVNERDANFTGFLACRFNSSPEFRYSAYFMAYRYCVNALSAVDSTAAQRVAQGVCADMRHDLEQYDAFFSGNKSETATKVVDTANDTILKASGNEEGVESYNTVSDLLVNWYFQEIVLPTQVEEEVLFDPLDETQVDLTGIVNAKLPEATEAVEEP